MNGKSSGAKGAKGGSEALLAGEAAREAGAKGGMEAPLAVLAVELAALAPSSISSDSSALGQLAA